MIHIVLHRVLVQMEDLKRKHTVTREDGTVVELNIAYGDMENRLQASTTEGFVVAVGDTAFKYYGYTESPVKVGDKVVFAKFAARPVFDPDEPEKKLAILNDEDVIAIIKSKEITYE